MSKIDTSYQTKVDIYSERVRSYARKVFGRAYDIELPPKPEYTWPIGLDGNGEVLAFGEGDIGEDDPDYYYVRYKGKEYKHFTSMEGARAYLEVLRNGENKEAGAVSKVHGVL